MGKVFKRPIEKEELASQLEAMRAVLENFHAWVEASDLECREDEDCDHCLLMQINEDAAALLGKGKDVCTCGTQVICHHELKINEDDEYYD